MTDKNTILAIVLSAIVLIAWQYFVGMPQQQAHQQQQQAQQLAKKQGEQPGQAVGYLPDGTMVIVEDADGIQYIKRYRMAWNN